MSGPLTSAEKQSIREMLSQNRSHNEIARATGRSQSTISGFAKREGYSPLPERTPSVANQARKDYAKAERMELIGLVFSRGEEMLHNPELTPNEYKAIVTGIAIGIDKARLEEGAATSRSETHSTRSGTIDLEREWAALDAQMQQEPYEETQYGSTRPD